MNNETAESLKSVIEKGSVEELLGPELEKVPWEAVVRGRITRDTVEELSKIKGEPDWMRRLRLRALEMFEKLPEPKWLPIKEEIDLESLVTYAKPSIERAKSWDEVLRRLGGTTKPWDSLSWRLGFWLDCLVSSIPRLSTSTLRSTSRRRAPL